MMQIVSDIQHILRQAQQNAYHSINKAMLDAYWLVGKRIVEEEQMGESRAAYGKGLMKNLSTELQKEFGKGFSVNNLQNMRLFYITYPIQQTVSANLQISETLSRKSATPDFRLSWSHYQVLMRILDTDERAVIKQYDPAKKN